MSIDAKQKELVVKLVGMFGSDFDGERATAAKKISDAAKARKITTADFLRLCFGSEKTSKNEYRWEEPPKRERYREASPNNVDLLHEMEELAGEWGETALTAWEREFVSDICGRDFGYLSEKQLAVVNRILAKLRKCGDDIF